MQGGDRMPGDATVTSTNAAVAFVVPLFVLMQSRCATAGQHDRPPQTAEAGLVRIRQGRHLAFLASMPWVAMSMHRVLLASCGSIVEAATLSITLPAAILYCLQPVSSPIHHSGDRPADKEPSTNATVPEGLELVKVMNVHKEHALNAMPATSAHEWELLRIGLDDIRPHNSPEAFDIVVIPAEGRDRVLSLDPALLQNSQVVVSEGIIDCSQFWQISTPQQQERLNLHMHRSGWEIYAKHSAFSSNALKAQVGSAEGLIKVALHITAVSHYRVSVQHHISRLIFSGLYDIAEGIYCFILGQNSADIEAAATFVQNFGRKIVVAKNSTHMELYERFTLLGMRAYLQPDDYFLYMHTKGVTHAADDLMIFDWVFYMHYFLVKHFSVCVGLLKKHFDICGVEYRFPDPQKPKVTGHYSGNFWWARASYYLSLPDSIGPAYTDPEMYVNLQTARHAALWESNTLLYSTKYPPSEFVDTAATALALPYSLPTSARS